MAYRVVYRGILSGRVHQSISLPGRYRTRAAAQKDVDKLPNKELHRYVVKIPKRRKKS